MHGHCISWTGAELTWSWPRALLQKKSLLTVPPTPHMECCRLQQGKAESARTRFRQVVLGMFSSANLATKKIERTISYRILNEVTYLKSLVLAVLVLVMYFVALVLRWPPCWIRIFSQNAPKICLARFQIPESETRRSPVDTCIFCDSFDGWRKARLKKLY